MGLGAVRIGPTPFPDTGTGMQNLSYDDRVKHLGLMRLNTRSLRSDLVETFKIINGNYSIDAEIFF